MAWLSRGAAGCAGTLLPHHQYAGISRCCKRNIVLPSFHLVTADGFLCVQPQAKGVPWAGYACTVLGQGVLFGVELLLPAGSALACCVQSLMSVFCLQCCDRACLFCVQIPGRTGDACIPGGGSYVDDDVGGCGSTGNGDLHIRFQLCFLVRPVNQVLSLPELWHVHRRCSGLPCLALACLPERCGQMLKASDRHQYCCRLLS